MFKNRWFWFGFVFIAAGFLVQSAADYKKFQHRDAANRSVTYFDNLWSDSVAVDTARVDTFNVPFKGHRLYLRVLTSANGANHYCTTEVIYEDATRDTLYYGIWDQDHTGGGNDLYTSRAIDQLIISKADDTMYFFFVQGNE